MADNNNGSVPQIPYSDKFEARPDSEKIEYLKKLSSSNNHALDSMQKERNDLLVKYNTAVQQILNLEQALEIQQGIVSQTITADNAEKNSYIERIQALEARIKVQDEVIERLNEGG